ncbi:MAG: hypothetical protein COU35_03435 [Candidatus Magasanikbacteria bacterium CG10_big_fil_rev_8_21_14_0_10_47_10]|uniref:Uncharacterized protein n=1 Tax=Candidatus Magasanikbacteria bacterium CG10_big_fil_rev_8_21_14_0_10_47_10 TaxID=1974652 RepID=A0A2H0TQ78_9BACT|nr:MAG: hypothetical protein COU35_03435 [Candidatus Magasanikbacteria bacterium CG10_big_fil_rev_8_21_14_0_10_47_10]
MSTPNKSVLATVGADDILNAAKPTPMAIDMMAIRLRALRKKTGQKCLTPSCHAFPASTCAFFKPSNVCPMPPTSAACDVTATKIKRT